MPEDTLSIDKAKNNDGGKHKEKCYPTEEGSENASGSNSSIRQTLSKKSCSLSHSSGRLENGNHQPPNPSPLRSTCDSGESDTGMRLTDVTHKSFKRKRSVNELVREANHVGQSIKIESNASSEGKKRPPACRYHDLFRAHTTTVEASDSANERVGHFTSSNSGGCRKKIPVVHEDDGRKEGRFGGDFVESTRKSDKGVLHNVSCASVVPQIVSCASVNLDAELQGFSKDLPAGTEGFKESNHKQKLIHEAFHTGGGGNKSKYLNKIFRLKIFWCERKAEIEENFKLESAVIRSINSNEAVRIDKLKMLEANHRKKLEELESEMSSRLNVMKAKHRDERVAEEKERISKMNEWKSWEENASNLPTKAVEVVPAKRRSSLGNGSDEENSKEQRSVGVHVPLLHTDAAEHSSSAEVASNYAERKMDINGEDDDISKSKSAVQINNEAILFGNVKERALDILGVQGWLQFASAVAAVEVEQIATSKNSPLSAENPTMQEVTEANEESTAVRMEQHYEAMNPSVAMPVSQMWNHSQPPTSLNFSSLHSCTVGNMSCPIGSSYLTNHLSPQAVDFEANTLAPSSGKISSNITTNNNYTFDQEVKSMEKIIVKKNTRTSLSWEDISQYFNMPIKVAARKLNISLTPLKFRCRELGIKRWPHRKLKSLQTLINNFEAIGREENNDKRLKEVIEGLAHEKRLVEEKPNLILQDQTKRLRQCYFKDEYRRKRLMVSLGGSGMSDSLVDDVQGGN